MRDDIHPTKHVLPNGRAWKCCGCQRCIENTESTPICPLFCSSVSSTFPSFAIKLEITSQQCNSSALQKVRTSFSVAFFVCSFTKNHLAMRSTITHKLKLLWCMYLSLLWASLILGHIGDWKIGREAFFLVAEFVSLVEEFLYDWIMGCGRFSWGIEMISFLLIRATGLVGLVHLHFSSFCAL